jgi:hypothetical protein
MSKKTVYLKIPKERAANIITKKHRRITAHAEGGKIKLYYKDKHWRATLSDYRVPREKVITPSGQSESGQVGTQMIYKSNKTSGRKCRKYVSDYEY